MPTAKAARAESCPEERRKTPRAPLLVQVECRRGGDFVLGQSQDVSEDGLSVQTRETIEPGTEVVVRFNLPLASEHIFIESRGVISHVRRGERMGIQFMQLSNRQREAIAGYARQASEVTTSLHVQLP